MKLNQIIFLIAVAAFIIFSSLSGKNIVKDVGRYKVEKNNYAEALYIKDRFFNSDEWLDFNGEEAWEEIKEYSESYRINANIYYKRAIKKSYSIGIYAILLFAITIALFWKSGWLKWKFLGYSFLTVAICFLILGIYVPMLELEAYGTDVTIQLDFLKQFNGFIDSILPGKQNLIPDAKVFKGEMYAFYQCKSAVDLIGILFESKNYPVGICILLFTVLIPIIKLIISFIVITLNRGKDALKKWRYLIKFISKWSMADVFVAASFLVYFSFDSMKIELDMGSTTLIGMYFFLAYCILSIVSSFVVELAVNRSEGLELENMV